MVATVSTVDRKDFEAQYAQKLIKRVVAKLRRSAKNRSRSEFARAYRLAADQVAHVAR